MLPRSIASLLLVLLALSSSGCAQIVLGVLLAADDGSGGGGGGPIGSGPGPGPGPGSPPPPAPPPPPPPSPPGSPVTGEQLAFVSQPGASGAVAGEPFAVQVAVVDSQGNTLPSAQGPITLSLVGPGTPGDRILRGPGLIVPAGGRATFAGLAVPSPGRYRFVARSAGLADLTSPDFDVQPLRGSGDFAAARIALASDQPFFHATGDLDGDGDVDLVYALWQRHQVAVRRGTGEGTFGPESLIGVGSFPLGVELADVDRDGRLDLIVADSGSNDVGVLRGNGDATFQPRVAHAVGSNPQVAVPVDLNGDGWIDVATASAFAGAVSVLLNDGSGGFAAATSYAVGGLPHGVAAGDLNGDGLVDLVSADRSSNAVSVLFNQGGGTFGGRVALAAGNGARTPIVADLNRDGRNDIVVSNVFGASVSIILATGPGTFAPQQAIAVGGQPNGLLARDLDGDGPLDLIVAERDARSVRVLFGDGAGGVRETVAWPAGFAAWIVSLAELDGDGRDDLVVTNMGDQGSLASDRTVSVLRGLPGGGFLSCARATAAAGSRSVAVGDLDGDGLRDLVVANQGPGTVSVFLQDRTSPGRFLAPTAYPAGGGAAGLAIADLDGDGALDVAVASSLGGSVSLLFQDPTRPGVLRPAVARSVSGTPRDVEAADLDGDGRVDLVVACDGALRVEVLLQTPGAPGSFGAPAAFGTGQCDPESLALTDLDSDGRLDVVCGGPDGARIAVLLADPAFPGRFRTATELTAASAPMSVAVADLDGDGTLDVFSANRDTNDVSVWSGLGTGALGARRELPVAGRAPWCARAADLDGDGRTDLAVALAGSGCLATLLQDPAAPGSFLTGPAWGGAYGPSWLELSDLDLDGRVDMASPGLTAGELALLRGR